MQQIVLYLHKLEAKDYYYLDYFRETYLCDRLYSTVSHRNECSTCIHKKLLFMFYIFTNFNKKRDTANMKVRLFEKYFSMVATVCCKTNNRAQVLRSPSNITNMQIIQTWKSECSKIFSMHSLDFWDLNLTQIPLLGFRLHKIFLP